MTQSDALELPRAARRLIEQIASFTGLRREWPPCTPRDQGLRRAEVAASSLAGRSRAAKAPMEALAQALTEGWLVSAATTPSHEDLTWWDRSCAVKDVIDVAGFPTGSGTHGAFWRLPQQHARAWAQLEAAGYTCAGKAATHEMAWGVTTPRIGNPHDQARIAGGSSGGSAAVVAAGIVANGLGTDTNGSIRIPAALCGAVGLRPTWGAVPLEGFSPLAPTQDTVGPLGPSVGHCADLLDVLAPGVICWADDAPTGIAGLRLGVLADTSRWDVATTEAMSEVYRALKSARAFCTPVDDLPFRLAGRLSLFTMLAQSAQHYGSAATTTELQISGPIRDLLTRGAALAPLLDDLEEARDLLGRETAAIFLRTGIDAVVTPTTPCVAPLRTADVVALGSADEPVQAALTRFTGLPSALGLPALSVPVRAGRLPVGAQVIGPPGSDQLCLRIGLWLEANTGASA